VEQLQHQLKAKEVERKPFQMLKKDVSAELYNSSVPSTATLTSTNKQTECPSLFLPIQQKHSGRIWIALSNRWNG